ncbi:LIM domain-binding protein 3 isoform X1 [Lethenteron reissneri]|uniref:LIM domain-binding protein 3 isoform X1 n=1 Tax=Lethenteron reissneri TaxID=7753 RepID=UPI002AB62A8A|nr:LIM domain-binding protein 3 isoform X1 [Lethenteron reissneri]XP_061406543.1 LIM domain-binding protein 3 isoform X1 [Lethenteron reissneri]
MSSYSVTLPGPAPWGFRLQGGKDFNMPLTISRVSAGSKAAQNGISAGDSVHQIDGVPTDNLTHVQAQTKIKNCVGSLRMTLHKCKRPLPMHGPVIDAATTIAHQKIVSPHGQDFINPTVIKDSAVSTHKPIEVRGPGGKASIIHAQYNTPISMYSQDAIMDAIAGQAHVHGNDVPNGSSEATGGLIAKNPQVDTTSHVYQAVAKTATDSDRSEEEMLRLGKAQSRTFRMLAQLTGTEYMQDPDEDALKRTREKFESQVKGPRFNKLKEWHHGLSASSLHIKS